MIIKNKNKNVQDICLKYFVNQIIFPIDLYYYIRNVFYIKKFDLRSINITT